MNELTKEIRKRLGLSQEELASVLGVSPISISRWENGKAKPSVLAEKQLFELCKNHNLELADYIVDSLKSENEGLVLYHASRNGITGNIKPISRKRCDFGEGFYTGTGPLQPLTLVSNEDHPIFYAVSLNTVNLKTLNIEVNFDWAMLIAYYRGYMDNIKESPLYEKYAHMTDNVDVVVGYIADDRMYQVLTDFFEQRITDTALMSSLSALDLGKQYVAISEKACDSISILKERSLTKLELMILKEKSIIRRKEGLSLAEKAAKEHRRDGKYFDEILGGLK